MSEEMDLVENRSEIVFVYDAERTNPNGNPMSSTNEPRIDKRTGHAIVTDVRLKRYIRDQLLEMGHNIYIRNTDSTEGSLERDELLEKTIGNTDRVQEILRNAGDEDSEVSVNDAVQEVKDMFLSNSMDARLFGATISVNGDDSNSYQLMDALNDLGSLTGPVQFSPAMSLNSPVQLNEEYDSLTSVISTSDGDGGGFDLDDSRLKYAVFPFHGVVNENAAENTHLTKTDIDQLDVSVWKSLKNQTITRSKVGQEPRLYLRVEYTQDDFHIGDLHNSLSFGEATPEMEDLRSGYEVCLDITELVSVLESHTEKIETVYVKASDVFDYQYNEDIGGEEFVYETLLENLGEETVDELEIYSGDNN